MQKQQILLQELKHINSAIAKEKQLKGGNRKAKLELIELNNHDWHDLYYDILN